MVSVQTGSDSPSDEFFIFHQALNAFFHIFERSDWKISVLPYDQLQRQVTQAYQKCGAVIAVPPNIPTEVDKTKMTDVMQWAHEKVSTPIYQLEVRFDPTYRNSNFLTCFDKNISQWINHYNSQQQSKVVDGLIGIAVFVGVVAVLALAAFFIYKKWKSSDSFGPTESGRLFKPSTDTSHLLASDADFNEGHGTRYDETTPFDSL